MRLALTVVFGLTSVCVCFAQDQIIGISDELTIPGGGEETFTITAPATPEGKIAVIHFRARMDHETQSGHSPGVRLWLGDAELKGDRLVNKLDEMQWGAGKISPWWGLGFRLMYSCDFEGNNRPDNKYYIPSGQAYTFDLDVTDLLVEGENTLTLAHAQTDPAFPRPTVVADLRLQFQEPGEGAIDPGPPTGPLPFIAPEANHGVEYAVRCTPLGGIILTVGGREWQVRSAFSDERGSWNELGARGPTHNAGGWRVAMIPQADGFRVEAQARDYTISRTVTPHPEYVRVEDTITNTSGRDIAFLQRHETSAEDIDDLYLAGLHPRSKTGLVNERSNPTTLVCAGESQICITSADDVLRAHSLNYCDGKWAGVRDPHGALAAGASQTYAWEIYPAAKTDYYAMVNAIRRARDVNFTIPGGFAFCDPREPFVSMSDEELGAWLDSKNARTIALNILEPSHRGRHTHGTAFLLADHTAKREFAKRVRRVRPGTKVLVYFHCFISTEEAAPEKYADARILAADGTGQEYPTGRPSEKGLFPMFLPLENNDYGQKMREYVEMILDECGADGVYWDEMGQSHWQFHYGNPWDGVSADVDPETLTITRKKSSVTLITQPFRRKLVERILDDNVPLIGNGAPITTTMSQYHFPRFIETASVSNLLRGQLYTPIGLGDHRSEVTGRDCASNMRRYLNYGGLYYFYHMQVTGAYPSITTQMFPCTPIELHEGYIIAEERILTNRSGNFGWGDASHFEVHVTSPRRWSSEMARGSWSCACRATTWPPSCASSLEGGVLIPPDRLRARRASPPRSCPRRRGPRCPSAGHRPPR